MGNHLEADITTIKGRKYVTGDRVIEDKPLPQGTHAMTCSNGCGFCVLVGHDEVAAVACNEASPLCVVCEGLLSSPQ